MFGLLAGAAIGSGTGGVATKRVMTLQFDPDRRTWIAYDSGLVPRMKSELKSSAS